MLNEYQMKFTGILIALFFTLVIVGCSASDQDEVGEKENLFYITDELKYGYMNQKGEVVIEIQYAEAQGFTEGLARVNVGDRENKKMGFINEKGEMVIEPVYEYVSGFSDGLAAN